MLTESRVDHDDHSSLEGGGADEALTARSAMRRISANACANVASSVAGGCDDNEEEEKKEESNSMLLLRLRALLPSSARLPLQRIILAGMREDMLSLDATCLLLSACCLGL